MAFDPICGKPVQPTQEALTTTYRSRPYYFCSKRCKDDFDKAAQKIRLNEALRVGALLSRGKIRWGLA